MNYLYGSDVQISDDSGGLAIAEIIDGTHYYLSNAERTDPGIWLVGQWHNDGTAVEVTPEYETLRPFGNNDDFATDQLDYAHWQGHAQRQVQTDPVEDTLPQYPADNQPIILTMERVWDDTPGWEGWGWLATIEFSDPTRAPNARAIGIYDSDWNYLYTTGAFIETDGKWQTNNPPGRATPDKDPLYYALLYGSIPEGQTELVPEQDMWTRNFWDHDQEGSPEAQYVYAAVDHMRAQMGWIGDDPILPNEIATFIGTLASEGWNQGELQSWYQPWSGSIIDALFKLMLGLKQGALTPP